MILSCANQSENRLLAEQSSQKSNHFRWVEQGVKLASLSRAEDGRRGESVSFAKIY